ncbi:hypothetical protein KAU08_00025 [bacterium]|nr:hypothetical protein [bacterium]
MRATILVLAVICFFLVGSPALAFDLDFNIETSGDISIGLGAGFGDEDVGPGVLSGKYVDKVLEIGIEGLYDGDEEDQIDGLAFLWLIYRYNLYEEERNTPYMGIGVANGFAMNSFQDDFGIMAAMGWDTNTWGLELKWGYFDPSLYTFVAYYHFD